MQMQSFPFGTRYFLFFRFRQPKALGYRIAVTDDAHDAFTIGMPEQAMTRCAELSVVHIDTGLSKGRKPAPSARLHLNSVPADQRLPSVTGHPGSVDHQLVS